MIPLHADLIAKAQQAHGTAPWIWLYQIVMDQTTIATTAVRLTPYPTTVAFGADTYYPFPVTHSDVISDDEGSLPEVDLALSNATRELARYAEVGLGFHGASVTITRTHADHAAAGLVAEQGTFSVSNVTLTRDVLNLRLSTPHLFRIRAPQDQYVRDRCRFRYGGDECGVVLDSAMKALHATCPKTLEACRDRGDAEVSLGRARLHPRRYGGTPGIPRDLR